MSTDPSVAPDADAAAPAEGWVGDPSAGREPEPVLHAEPEPVPPAGETSGSEPEPVAGVEAELEAETEPEPVAGAEAAADPLAEAIRERDEYLDALRHLQADFENYRKRVQKQAAEQSDRATEGLVSKLLPVLDTVDLALAHASGEAQEAAGLGQVATSLLEVLGKEGLVRIDALGQPFDPSEHDAVLHEAAEERGAPEVVEVLRSGWRWRERVLRPAMVKVKG